MLWLPELCGATLGACPPVAVVCCFSWPSRGEESQERYVPLLQRAGVGLGMAQWCLMPRSVVGPVASYIHSLNDMTANMTNSSLVQAVWGLDFTGQTTLI